MRKQPQQARSIKTRQQLIDVLGELLKEQEFDQITVADIASKAGVSTGLLYSHFANKADFLEVLLEEYMARVIQRLEEVEQNDVAMEFREVGGLREALRLIASYAYDQLAEDAHIIRAISHFLRSQPENEKSDWQDLRRRAFHTIAPIMDVYDAELARPNNSKTAEMLVYFFNTIFIDALLFHKPGKTTVEKVGKDAFIKEIADFAYGYLTTAPK